MPKTAKRPTARKTAKPRTRTLPAGAFTPDAGGPPDEEPGSPRAAKRESVEDPLEDFFDEEPGQDAWLIEREADDIQRDDH